MDGFLFYTVPSSGVLRLFLLKTVGAGAAGSPTLLSLADRDLFFQDPKVVAARGAPTPRARVLMNPAI
jgi:hypothetical protein